MKRTLRLTRLRLFEVLKKDFQIHVENFVNKIFIRKN